MPRDSASHTICLTSSRPTPRLRHSESTATDRSTAVFPHTSRPATATIRLGAAFISATKKSPGLAPMMAATPAVVRSADVNSRSIAGRSSRVARRTVAAPVLLDVVIRITSLRTVQPLSRTTVVGAPARTRRWYLRQRRASLHRRRRAKDGWLCGAHEAAHDPPRHAVGQSLVEAGPGQQRSSVVARVDTRRLDARVLETGLR